MNTGVAKSKRSRRGSAPIGLWAKLAPEAEETVQGLLLRIAAMQLHASTDRTVAAAGVRRAAVARGLQPDIGMLAKQILQDPAELAADSLQRDARGRLLLRGHAIPALIEFGRRRLCPACVDEAPHHRFWWDIGPITTCPRHGLELVEQCSCGKKFGWRDGSLLKCARRHDGDHGLRRTAADPKVLRADAYLLSRFDAGQAESVPVLDALSVRDVFETLERIGAAACGGYSYEWQSADSLNRPLAAVQAFGFEVLADNRIDEVLTCIYDGFLAAGGRPEEGFTSCYGWLYHWFNHKRGAKFSPLLAQAFLEHGAARFPIVPKARLGRLRPAAERKLSLKAAAKRAETSVYTMKRIGLALGLIRSEKRSGSQLSFPVEEVERIARDLKGAMTLDETMARLGVGAETMVALMEDGSLVPALRGGDRRHSYVFRPQDVDAMLTGLAGNAPRTAKPREGLIAIASLGRGRAATIAGCIKMVLNGHLQVRARLGGDLRLKALFVDHGEVLRAASGGGETLPFGTAAVRMRLNARGLRKAIEGGFIEGVKPGADTVPANVAGAFAERFMMMGEIRDRLGGRFAELRVHLRMAGFHPDPDLEKCLCAGYLRSDIEPFLRKVEAGDVRLGKPEGGWKALVREAEKILAGAKAPVRSAHLLAKLRRKMTIGPSDQTDFFYGAMWGARETFVHIESAGWWLRARSYLGRTFLLDGPAPTQTEIVDQTVVDLLRAADRPLSQEGIMAWLKAQSIAIPIADSEVFLRRLAVRHADAIIKLTGLGYWDRARPYPPALYDPATWKEKTQTAVQRAGLWIIKLLNETGRPLSRAELESMLRERGIIPGKCTRAYTGNAVAEFASEIVYLDRVGYWLARKPWPPAGYRPAGRKQAA